MKLYSTGPRSCRQLQWVGQTTVRLSGSHPCASARSLSCHVQDEDHGSRELPNHCPDQCNRCGIRGAALVLKSPQYSKSQKRAKKTKGKVKQRWLQAFCKKRSKCQNFGASRVLTNLGLSAIRNMSHFKLQ